MADLSILKGKKKKKPKSTQSKKAANKRRLMDRKLVAKSKRQVYELDYFCHKHNLTRFEGRQLMKQFGTSRKKLDEAAEKLKAGELKFQIDTQNKKVEVIEA